MSVRHAILGLLIERPMHGYEIDNAFEKGLRSFCHVNISQIYAYLKSMEKKGWIENEVVMQKSNPPKKVFNVTAAGRREMTRWLAQPVREERQLRDELLTKVYFCWSVNPDMLPALIDEQLLVYGPKLATWQGTRAQAEGFMERALTDAGTRHLQADYDWLLTLREEVAQQLQQANREPELVHGG